MIDINLMKKRLISACERIEYENSRKCRWCGIIKDDIYTHLYEDCFLKEELWKECHSIERERDNSNV